MYISPVVPLNQSSLTFWKWGWRDLPFPIYWLDPIDVREEFVITTKDTVLQEFIRDES